jgi:hypothetical protein
MNTETEAKTPNTAPEIDPLRLQRFIQEIKDNQSLLAGTLAGLAAALVGAGLWGVITALTKYQIGWMAVGVGFLVGMAVRTFGKGIDKPFGIAGAGISVLGCMAGNLLAVCIMISQQQQVPFSQILSGLNPEVATGLIKATFNPMDLLFYGLAIYAGYRFSFRRISAEELAKLTK